MPFGSYEESREQAFRNASRVLKETGAGAIKMEGGVHMAETVAFLVRRGMPVMGHVGLTPQSVNTMGGFRVQGRSEEGQKLLEADARAIADAGAFAIVLEGIIEPVARAITESDRRAHHRHRRLARLRRADPRARGHAGPLHWMPKFVKRFGSLREHIEGAVAAYADEVRAGSFPGPDQVYQITKR